MPLESVLRDEVDKYATSHTRGRKSRIYTAFQTKKGALSDQGTGNQKAEGAFREVETWLVVWDGLREMLRGLSQTYEERAEFRRRMLLPMRSLREANRGRVNALDLAGRMEQSRYILPRRWADKTRGDMR